MNERVSGATKPSSSVICGDSITIAKSSHHDTMMDSRKKEGLAEETQTESPQLNFLKTDDDYSSISFVESGDSEEDDDESAVEDVNWLLGIFDPAHNVNDWEVDWETDSDTDI